MSAEHVTRDNTHLVIFAQVCSLKTVKSYYHINIPQEFNGLLEDSLFKIGRLNMKISTVAISGCQIEGLQTWTPLLSRL